MLQISRNTRLAEMKVKTTQVCADSLVVREQKLEIDRESSEQKFQLEGDDRLAVVLVEVVSGHMNISIEGVSGEQLSKYRSVTLYAGRVAEEQKGLAVRLASRDKATVRLTIAFFSRPVDNATKRFSCKDCTVMCRFVLRTILAYQGISYLDAETTVDLPDVIDPDTESPMDWFNRPISESNLGVDPKNTVPVLVGEPIALGENCKKFFTDGIYDSGHHPLGDLIERLGPQLMGAMRDALESANWGYDASDGLYSNACRRLGCSES